MFLTIVNFLFSFSCWVLMAVRNKNPVARYHVLLIFRIMGFLNNQFGRVTFHSKPKMPLIKKKVLIN